MVRLYGKTGTSAHRLLKKAVSKAVASEGPKEVHTALRVGRSPL